MKKKNLCYLFAVAAALSFVLFSCDKPPVDPTPDPDPTPVVDPVDTLPDDPVMDASAFVGTYDLTIDVEECYVNGEYTASGEQYVGVMTISPTEEPSVVKISAKVTMGGVPNVEMYNTTAMMTQDGVILPAPSTFTNPNSGAQFGLSYDEIHLGNPLNFNSELSANVAGYELRYVMSNRAVKR